VSEIKSKSGDRRKAPRDERGLVEIVERLQRDVSESSAKVDWHSAVEETLEKEIQSLRTDLTRIAERGSQQWREEARGWFEVHAEMLATKLDELSRASEARLERRIRQLDAAVEQRVGDVGEHAQAATTELTRTATEQRLSRAEQRLESMFESTVAEMERKLFEAMVQWVAKIERNVERRAEAAVEALGDRVAAITGARLALETEQRLDGIVQAESAARERLLELGEELAAEIVVAEQAQQREREIHSEAKKVAAGLGELRDISRRGGGRAAV
jgi:hypothetical protein